MTPVCREDQIKQEVADLFDFMRSFYGMLGLTFKLKLSTRPDKFMGEIETWDRAEARLKEALDEFAASGTGVSWELNAGDGAFYGPKIDIAVLVCITLCRKDDAFDKTHANCGRLQDCLNVRGPLLRVTD